MHYFNLHFRSAASCNTSDHAATHQHTVESRIMSNDLMYEKIDKQICIIQSVTLRRTKYNYKKIISSPFICADAYEWSILRKNFLSNTTAVSQTRRFEKMNKKYVPCLPLCISVCVVQITRNIHRHKYWWS